MPILTAAPPTIPPDAERPGEASLPILQTAGFSATVDAYAWEPDTDSSVPRMRLWFLSLLGSQEAVKALWARLIKGETATMALEHLGVARFCALAAEGPRRWRFFTASLRAVAGHHGVLVPESALFAAERPDFVLLPRSAEEAAPLHARFLNRRLDLPLHPLWAEWLWERGLRTGEVVALESLGILAYRCVPNPEALARDLGEAIRRRALPMPDTSSTAALERAGVAG